MLTEMRPLECEHAEGQSCSLLSRSRYKYIIRNFNQCVQPLHYEDRLKAFRPPQLLTHKLFFATKMSYLLVNKTSRETTVETLYVESQRILTRTNVD